LFKDLTITARNLECIIRDNVDAALLRRPRTEEGERHNDDLTFIAAEVVGGILNGPRSFSCQINVKQYRII
jgi:hypothetical protein